MLDDRDNWRILQSWLIKNFHAKVYERWLEMAVLSGAINLPGYELNPRAYCCPKFTPRGFDWVDPAKEINASRESIRGGLSTLSRELAEKGIDIEELFEERRRELDLAESLQLNFDTDPALTDPQQISVIESQ